MKLKELEKYLLANGCIKKREGANPSIWENPVNGNCSSSSSSGNKRNIGKKNLQGIRYIIKLISVRDVLY